MANRFKSPIFVLGLPRSGTSMVAGALAACGAWTGTTVPPGKANPKGFFEHVVIREKILKSLLKEMDCDPLGVRKLPTGEMLNQLAGVKLANTIKKAIQADGYSASRNWLYKDAKLTLLWPLFASAFPRAQWVIVRRERDAFVDSCLRTSFMVQHSTERAFWEALYEEYTQRLRELKARQSDVYVVDAKKIASGDFQTLKRLCQVLKLNYNQEKVEAFVSQDLFTPAK